MSSTYLSTLVDEADSIYSAGKKGLGIQGIFDWMQDDSTGYKHQIYNYLGRMNSKVSTSRFSLDDVVKKQIVEELSGSSKN